MGMASREVDSDEYEQNHPLNNLVEDWNIGSHSQQKSNCYLGNRIYWFSSIGKTKYL